MLDFYILPQMVRIGISVLGTVVVITQAFYLAYSCFGGSWRVGSFGKYFFEGIMLIYLVLLATPPAVISINIKDGIVTQNMLESPRLLVFTMLFFTAIAHWRKNKALLLVTLITAMTLPPMEGIRPYLFAELWVVVLLVHLYRSVRNWQIEKHALSSSISSFSIKEAVDALSSGLMFYEIDGSILLINRRMQELMVEVCGKASTNGHSFQKCIWEEHKRRAVFSIEANVSSGAIVRFSGGEVWWFSKNRIREDKKTYFQLSASNVSQQWQLVEELELQKKRLQEQSKNLRQFIDNLFQIRHHQAILQMRNKIHDVLGQHISLFVRKLEREENFSAKEVNQWITELITQLYARVPSNATAQLQEMKELFESVGVALCQRGDLPGDALTAECFVAIIREASTNAVRHGLATIVRINMEETDEVFVLMVTDNGTSLSENAVPGGGIRSMRHSVQNAGGELSVKTHPQFSITAQVPRVKTHAKEVQ